MKIRDTNIRENEYAGETYAKSNFTLQVSSVQYAECQYKVKTIVMYARQIGHPRPWSWTRLAQSIQNL